MVRKSITYPSIYNFVITKKMADELKLDFNNPYVEVLTVKKNDKFIAKEASIFEEEKNVADKAPVTSININDLSVSTSENEEERTLFGNEHIRSIKNHIKGLDLKKYHRQFGQWVKYKPKPEMLIWHF